MHSRENLARDGLDGDMVALSEPDFLSRSALGEGNNSLPV